MKKNLKVKISEAICLVLGIAFAIVGLYYFHMQYLCFEYTPLQFILGFVVCLGGALLSIPLSKKTDKKKKNIECSLDGFGLCTCPYRTYVFDKCRNRQR